MDTAFLTARITATRALIVSLEDALAGLAADPTASFSIDTGQTKKVVTSINISELRNSLDSAYSRLYALEARLYGGSVTAVPGW